MSHPVVSCYHGADTAAGVQLGGALAGALGVPLVLASAYHYEPVALGSSVVPPSGNEIRLDAAESGLHRAHRLVAHDVEVIERVIPADDVAAALCGLAHEVDASLLVVGRDLDGHVTREVLQQAPCPVAVSPYSVPVPGQQPLAAVGVAYDASPSSRLALTAAMHLAVRTGARVEVLSAGSELEPHSVQADAAAASISEAVDVRVRLLQGRAADTLVEASDGLDLLLCGTHGRGRLMAAVLGSVSGRLVQAAHCPVIVVPPRVRHRATAPLGLTTAGVAAG